MMAAIKLVKQTANAKFKESFDVAIRLGVDSRKSDQNVRGVSNPHGVGKDVKIAVFADVADSKDLIKAGIKSRYGRPSRRYESWKS